MHEEITSPDPVAEGNAAFALALYDRLRSAPGNLFFSPFSVSAALASVYAGARGETAAQMARVLGFPHSPGELLAPFDAMNASFREFADLGHVVLRAANSLWTHAKEPLQPEFLELMTGRPWVEASAVNFDKKPAKICKVINRWVHDRTEGRITDLITPDNISALTRLIVVNAIYFKGDWAVKFNRAMTMDEPFLINAEQSVPVPMMRHDRGQQYNLWQDDRLQVLRLPYLGDGLSMAVFLPAPGTALEEIESELTAERVAELSSPPLVKVDGRTVVCLGRNVRVLLPRFRMRTSLDLGQILSAMGMPDAFDGMGGADFSGMSGPPGWFYIGDVLHQAFVDVNEEGTEAAAATGVFMDLFCGAPEPPVFRADRPFLFFIREERTGSILFIGRVVDPSD